LTDKERRTCSWQGIEQQLLWLNCKLEDLPVDEILEAVSKQVQSDKETGKEPPLN